MEFTALQTLAIGCMTIPLGYSVKRFLPFFDRYNFPVPVVGGLFFSLFFSGYQKISGQSVQFDSSLSTPLMIMFFSSLGYEASFRSLREGGHWVARFLGLAVLVLFLQVAAGILVSHLIDQPLLTGVLASAVSLVGGPGTTLAFAPTFASHGVPHAETFGLAMAIGGIVLGGLVGSPIATWLIQKMQLKPLLFQKKRPVDFADDSEGLPPQGFSPNKEVHAPPLLIEKGELLHHLVVFGLILGIGTTLSSWIKDMGVTLPVYIGCMAVASLIRNFEDTQKKFGLRTDIMDRLGGVALTLFIGTATATLNLGQLWNSVFEISIFLTSQCLLLGLISYFVIPKAMGDDYEAVVMSGGFFGFMMGTSANALATMTAVTDKYGPAPRAFFVVPIVGACFIDFINAGVVTALLNFLN